MSLVGPRPLRSFEVEALTTWQLERQSVRPGITGLWQVLGRSSVAWDQRMQLDYTYARHWTPGSDLKILAQTLPAVMRRHGAR
jgi:lipopolysaccharide/colanic/teichoic acid biosynthesis glycosyltransferase